MRRAWAASVLVAAWAFACGELQSTDDPTTLPPRDDGGGREGPDGAASDGGCAQDTTNRCRAELLATGIGKAYAMRVGAGFVYTAATDTGVVARTRTSGGGAEAVDAGLLGATAIVASNGTAFVASFRPGSNHGVARVELGKALVQPPAILSDCDGVAGIAGNDVELFWIQLRCDAGVQRRDGSFVADGEGDGAPASTGHLAMDDTHVYWTANRALRRAPKDLANFEDLADFQFSPQIPRGLAVDATGVYLRTDTAVFRFAKSGPQSPDQPLAYLGASDVARSEPALDDAHVYVASEAAKAVLRIPKSGGPKEVFASDSVGPIAVAVDESFVYWTNQNGELWKRPK